jgi:hypothetical protein
MEIALLVSLFLIGTFGAAIQALKRLDRRPSATADDRKSTDR